MKKKRRILPVVMILLLSAALVTGCGSAEDSDTDKGNSMQEESGASGEGTKDTQSEDADNSMQEESGASDGDTKDTQSQDADNTAAATDYAKIEIKDFGTVTVALNADAAPETVENFISLAKDGFYDGLTFHRIMDGFMMQGGDPNGNGTGGAENTITGEFADNGFENDLSHTRGAISMARSNDYNSASSQFFIVHKDSQFLDGQYAVFGYVTEGMDVVDAICSQAEPTDDNGTIPPKEQPVITSITIQ